MIRLRQIKILVEEASDDKILSKCSSKLGIKRDDIIDFNIVKRSIDAREKPSIYYSYKSKNILIISDGTNLQIKTNVNPSDYKK